MRVGSFLLSKWAFKSRGVCTKCIEGSNPKPLCPDIIGRRSCRSATGLIRLLLLMMVVIGLIYV